MRSRLAPRVSLVLLVVLATGFVGVSRARALSYAAPVGYATGAGPDFVATGDFNGDGIKDLAAGDYGTTTVSILLGDGSGGFGAKADFAAGAGPQCIAVGDFNSDGKQDLAVANNGDWTVSVLLGDGTGSFAGPTDYGAGEYPTSVAVDDFNGDGKQDMAVTGYWSDAVRIWLGDGSGGFGSPTDYGTGMYPSSVAVGDFNHDGKKDLAVADAGGNAVSILLGNGSGGFGAASDFAAGLYPWCVAIGDFNGDGKQDLATANHSSGTVSVFLGDGSGGFAGPTDYAAGLYPTSVAVGDVNHDGDQDLVAANSGDGTVSVFLNDGSGGFDAKTDFTAGLGSRSVAIGDFNGDDVRDLATADTQANTVSVLLNTPWGTTTINGGDAATESRIVRIGSTAYGATQMRLRDQGNAWSAWQSFSTFTYWTLPSGDGAKTVEVQYRNGATRCPAQAATILLDTAPPTTTDDAPAGWQSAAAVPLTVSLAADDGSGSGVAQTQYKVDGATSWSSGDSVVLASDGTHAIKYRSTDNAGNVEETQYASVKLDATAPDVSLQGVDSAWHAGPVMALIVATDATSGVRATSYDLDGAGWLPGSGLLVTAEGDHTLGYRATDNAGNTAATQHAHIKIDLTPPTTTDDAPAGWVAQAVTIHFSASDALSGMGASAATMYSRDGGATWRAGTTFTIRAHPKFHSTDGLEVLYRSTDAVGNIEAVKACTVPIDTRPPTTTGWVVRCTKGGRAVFKFKVIDPTPGSSTTSATQPVRIKIRNASGRVVKTLTAAAPYATNHRALLVWAKCTLAKGKYTYAVYAHDQAGNVQIKAKSARFRVE